MLSIPKVVFASKAVSFLLLFTKPAYAYLDPGTGSMVIQAVLAGIAAVGVSIGLFWKRIKLFFGRISGWKQKEERNQNEKSGA